MMNTRMELLSWSSEEERLSQGSGGECQLHTSATHFHNGAVHLGVGKEPMRHYFQEARRAAPAVAVHFVILALVATTVKSAVVARSSVRTVNVGTGVSVLEASSAVAVIAAACKAVVFTQSPSFSSSYV